MDRATSFCASAPRVSQFGNGMICGSATDAAAPKDGTLASGPEGGSQGATPSSPRVNPL